MMKKTLIFGILSIVTLVAANAEEPRVDFFKRVRNFYKGQNYEAIITHAMLKGVPEWLEFHEDPPLSARKAMIAAKNQLLKKFPEAPAWKVATVRLEPLPMGHWIYIVSFDPTPTHGTAFGKAWPEISVIVLMSGQSIEMQPVQPRVNPRNEKPDRLG